VVKDGTSTPYILTAEDANPAVASHEIGRRRVAKNAKIFTHFFATSASWRLRGKRSTSTISEKSFTERNAEKAVPGGLHNFKPLLYFWPPVAENRASTQENTQK
jgi:hypothetical protein